MGTLLNDGIVLLRLQKLEEIVQYQQKMQQLQQARIAQLETDNSAIKGQLKKITEMLELEGWIFN